MKVSRTAAVAKEFHAQARGILALPVDEGLTPFQQKLWADVLGLKARDDWTEADRPLMRAYVDEWEAYRKAKATKDKREIFAHIVAIGNALNVISRSREKNTSGVNRAAKGARAKQTRRAVNALASNNVERLLATPQ